MANEIKFNFGILDLDNNNNITIANISVKEKKNIQLAKIPKSDGSVAEIARREALTISVEGDIAGSDYDDLRTNKDTLKAGLLNGIQEFRNDDDRYIKAQCQSIDFDDVAFRILSKWRTQFIAHYPFWLSGVDKYTKLLLHCNGQDGATAFIDDATGKTVTVSGNAQIDTAQSVFGGASGLFDGTGDYLSLADSDDWNFGAGDFTIDFRIPFTTLAGLIYFLGHRTDNDNVFYVGVNVNGELVIYLEESNVVRWNVTTSGAGIAINTWYHIALVKSGSSVKIYINGVCPTNGSWTDAVAWPDFTGNLTFGAATNEGGSAGCLTGWMGEIRISKGIARWTADFTPPTVAYSSQHTDIRTPTSGVGYTINNAGNAPARVKIEVTAPGGGIADNCQIENTTRGELCKYRGTIAAADVLEIDNHYDTDDFEVLNDGVSDMKNFEGDFIMLSPGDNTIEYTGTAGAQIKLTFRDTYY